jgi:hypothetical protein
LLSQVSDLYAALLRWDSVAQALPTVVRRLQSLAALHEESASALGRLATLETQLQATVETVAHDSQLLSQVCIFCHRAFFTSVGVYQFKECVRVCACMFECKQLETSMVENARLMSSNMVALQARFDALAKRVEETRR